MDKNVTVNKDMSTYRLTKQGSPTQPSALHAHWAQTFQQFCSRGSAHRAWTNSMNQEQRQDDRPRVASFLIDDILAPQAVPSAVQCPSPQSAAAVEQSSSTHISTQVTDNRLLLCHQPLSSTCLACCGKAYCIYFTISALNSVFTQSTLQFR